MLIGIIDQKLSKLADVENYWLWFTETEIHKHNNLIKQLQRETEAATHIAIDAANTSYFNYLSHFDTDEMNHVIVVILCLLYF